MLSLQQRGFFWSSSLRGAMRYAHKYTDKLMSHPQKPTNIFERWSTSIGPKNELLTMFCRSPGFAAKRGKTNNSCKSPSYFRLEAIECEAPGPNGVGSAAIISTKTKGNTNHGMSTERSICKRAESADGRAQDGGQGLRFMRWFWCNGKRAQSKWANESRLKGRSGGAQQ